MILMIIAAFVQGPTPMPAEPAIRPNLAFEASARHRRDFWRYFYFWKPGVTTAIARADLIECQAYASDIILWADIPDRMSFSPESLRPGYTGAPFGGLVGGLVGGLAVSLAEGPLTNRIVFANLRKCMGFKGYRRYGLTRDLWRHLHEGDPERIIERLALVASGPEPSAESLDR